jgi:Transposase.
LPIPLQVKAIAQAHVKTDKIDAGTLASLHAAGYLPQIWTPDAETERKRRLVARRYQVVRHRTRLKCISRNSIGQLVPG